MFAAWPIYVMYNEYRQRNGGKIMGSLDDEFKYYLDHQDELVQKYEGKYLVIKNQQVQGAFDKEIDAYKDASEKHELGTFLIQLCLPGEASHTQTYHSRVNIK